MTDAWVRWHDKYDVPGSSLSVRLDLVAAHVARAVDARPAGPVRLVSACAGQGRDVVRALREHPRRGDVTGRLVELDPVNAADARDRIAAAGLSGLEVLEADAGATAAYAGAVPAGVILMCGVFGNVTDEDIRATVHALPEFAEPGARVIWTRHRGAPDVTPRIRGWFAEAGFREVAFDAPEPFSVGVGVHELAAPPRPLTADRRLFTFVTG
ncbi:class I SAM-dependent methyltransferase family protein [Dactylosporangium sp. CA-139066]|uniref:class I SAM-dependent methyltransferase family protein n=1 Tax=Dactylosporangium sp. CA-139066 TaxID=3239930 RepID=UPI003D938E47